MVITTTTNFPNFHLYLLFPAGKKGSFNDLLSGVGVLCNRCISGPFNILILLNTIYTTQSYCPDQWSQAYHICRRQDILTVAECGLIFF